MSDFGDIYSHRHEDNRIFFSANETNLQQFSHDLPSTIVPDRLFVFVEVYHRIRPDRPPSGNLPVAECCIATCVFTNLIDHFASADDAKPAVEAMLSEIELPFRLDGDESRTQLRWKEGSGDGDDFSDASSEPLDGVGPAAARVSEVGARIVASALASGRGARLEMRVTIRKVTVVSAELYGAMFEGYGELSDETQMFIQEVEVMEEQLRDLAEGLPPAEQRRVLRRFYSNDDRLFEAEAGRRPSAAAAMEALETVVYEGGGGEANKLTCPICIDDVAVGCHVTRLSCSHRFHRDCIGKWLEKRRTCPLCRSKL